MSMQILRATFPQSAPSFELIFEHIPSAALVVDDGDVVRFENAAAVKLMGGSIRGLALNDIFSGDFSASDGLEGPAMVVAAVKRTGIHVQATFNAITSGYRVVELLSAAVDETSGNRDELTGLLKRNDLDAALHQALQSASPASPLVAVLCLDLDRFKIVNDTLGHPVGDLLLKKVANRLRSACRADDVIARVGGDEFVVVQKGLKDQVGAEELAARIVDLVGRTYVLNGHTINIGVSVGVALNASPLTQGELLRNADLALYEAKQAGRSRYRMFEKGMETSLARRREMEIELRRALALRQFELHYQPFFELKKGSQTIAGFEALIRWNHPDRGMVSPLSFIPLAEETGLINQIGEWVIRTACNTAATWPNDLVVAVNISPTQFKADGLVTTITSALSRSGLEPGRLEIEITEGALLDNTREVLATLRRLQDLGVKVSMDDFGTGYSSLSYLQKFPFNKIKIDRSFVQDHKAGSENDGILKAISGLGKSLGIAITAEGVENQQQLERVRGESCTFVQGFLTGRPMPEAEIANFLRSS